MKTIALLLTAVALLALASAVVAQSPVYDLSWWTADGGGGTSTSAGGAYTLSGTIGQPDAAVLSGGAFTLSGGFWSCEGAMPPPGHKLYLPLVLRNT